MDGLALAVEVFHSVSDQLVFDGSYCRRIISLPDERRTNNVI